MAYDGPIIASDLIGESGRGGDSSEGIRQLLAAAMQLVAVALYTDRILVLPTLFHDGRFIRLWELLGKSPQKRQTNLKATSVYQNDHCGVITPVDGWMDGWMD